MSLEKFDPLQVSNHVISTLENRLNMLYSYVRHQPANLYAKHYICINGGIIHSCFAVIVSHENTSNFGNIREIISFADGRTKDDTTHKGTLFLIVDDWQVGNNLIEKIERINDFVSLTPLFISLVIKNSNPFGPISIHGAILFDSINAHSRNSPKF